MRFLSGLDRWQYRTLVGLWIAGILTALSVPLGGVPKMDRAPGLDLVVHLVLFAGLAVLAMRALRPDPASDAPERLRIDALWTLGLGTVFAAATEVFQHFLPTNRSADPLDFVADAVGLVLGTVAYVVRRRRHTVGSADA